jgi:hypothetical protein
LVQLPGATLHTKPGNVSAGNTSRYCVHFGATLSPRAVADGGDEMLLLTRRARTLLGEQMRFAGEKEISRIPLHVHHPQAHLPASHVESDLSAGMEPCYEKPVRTGCGNLFGVAPFANPAIHLGQNPAGDKRRGRDAGEATMSPGSGRKEQVTICYQQLGCTAGKDTNQLVIQIRPTSGYAVDVRYDTDSYITIRKYSSSCSAGRFRWW